MIKISEFVNTICENYRQIDKYYNQKEIYNIIQKEVKYAENKDDHRIKIDNTYHYDEKFLKNILNKINFDNLKYKTLEQIYEERLSNAKIKLNDTLTINNIKYLTLDIILEYIYAKNQKKFTRRFNRWGFWQNIKKSYNWIKSNLCLLWN